MSGDHPIFERLEDELLHGGRTAADWFTRHHETSAAPAAATATIKQEPQEEPVSLIADAKTALKDAEGKLENIDEEAVTKLEEVKANPKTATAFDLIHGLSGFDPGPLFDAVVTFLQAMQPATAAATGQQPAVAGPQVAGQA